MIFFWPLQFHTAAPNARKFGPNPLSKIALLFEIVSNFAPVTTAAVYVKKRNQAVDRQQQFRIGTILFRRTEFPI